MKNGRLIAMLTLAIGLYAAIGYLAFASKTIQTVQAASVITVDTTTDDLTVNNNCTLREAIQAANTDSPVDGCAAGSGADEIVLGLGLYRLSISGWGEDNNATGDLDVTESLTITGIGSDFSHIAAFDIDRVLDIQYGVETVVISGVTFRRPRARKRRRA